jgi:hypothetical protein
MARTDRRCPRPHSIFTRRAKWAFIARVTRDAARVGTFVLLAVRLSRLAPAARLPLVARLACLVSLAACRSAPSTGSPCRVADLLVCGGAASALACVSGAWIELPCRGPRGCARRGDTDECDDAIAADGDVCPHNPPVDYACTTDRTKALICQHGRFSLWRNCRGPDKCDVVDGHIVHCDTTLGEAGDPCEKKGAYACAVDRQTMLACGGTTLATASSCRGPQGCQVQRETRKVDCDDSVAIEGDACESEKRIACTIDRKAELSCAGGKYVKKRECRRTDCRLEENQLFCD